MKIGILTFHNADNYGSVLQSYALKTFVENNINESECEIINFVPPNQKELYALYLPCKNIKNLIKNIRAFIFSKLLKSRIKEFSAFREKYLNVRINSELDNSNIRTYLNEFDVIICGSDQIWNPRSQDFSIEYFLPRYTGKKISYAPSFGNGCVDDFRGKYDKNIIKEYIENFDALSVREYAGIQMFKDLEVKKDVKVVLDPTLLIKENQWNSIAEKKQEGDYIFFYSIDYRKEAIEMVKEISKKTGLEVRIMFSTNKTYSALGNGFKLIKDTSPSQFLAMVRDAKIVLSTSFHGLAFSVIYRKNFYALETKRENGYYVDERIHTLMKTIEISNRIIRKDKIQEINFNEPVIYNEIAINNASQEASRYIISNILGR